MYHFLFIKNIFAIVFDNISFMSSLAAFNFAFTISQFNVLYSTLRSFKYTRVSVYTIMTIISTVHFAFATNVMYPKSFRTPVTEMGLNGCIDHACQMRFLPMILFLFLSFQRSPCNTSNRSQADPSGHHESQILTWVVDGQLP